MRDTRDNELDDLLNALRGLLDGRLGEAEFRARYQSNYEGPAVLDEIWQNVEHYLADEDIRARDAAYRAMQDNEMRKLIQLLERDAPTDVIADIDFLHETRK